MAIDVVGRDQELAMVERLLDERQAGPLAVIIEGDAGIGKTTLWAAALDLAVTGRGGCWRPGPLRRSFVFPTRLSVTCSARS
jgi:hypothetical protein